MRFSGRWSAALNTAYRVLRDRDHRIEYLVTLWSPAAVAKPTSDNGVPADLALLTKEYFEVDDCLTDPTSRTVWEPFRDKLLALLRTTETEQDEALKKWKAGNQDSILKGLIDRKRFLDSMLRDLNRKTGHS